MSRVLSFVVALAVVGCIAATPVEGRRRPRWHELSTKYTFEEYVRDFKKPYTADSAEGKSRRPLFERRLKETLLHNANPAMSYKQGVNEFSDNTDRELRGRNMGIRPDRSGLKPLYTHQVPQGYVPPRSVDWRLESSPRALTAIKSQGYCGSCWAFAATESMESAYALLTGELHEMSPQQVTSCSNISGCWEYQGQPIGGGCGGGMVELAVESIKAQGGIQSNWIVPYLDWFSAGNITNTTACSALKTTAWQLVAKPTGYVHIDTNNPLATMHALATVGPLAVYVAALPWYYYEEGIFVASPSNPFYNSTFRTDHVTQLVGYGHDYTLSMDYWIVRNSWGAWWGEAGFIRLFRNSTVAAPCGMDVPNFLKCHNISNGQMACGTSAVLVQPLYIVMEEL